MIVIICICVMFVGFIILSKAEKPKENEIKHKCLYATTCKEAPKCFNEQKESCFIEKKIENK